MGLAFSRSKVLLARLPYTQVANGVSVNINPVQLVMKRTAAKALSPKPGPQLVHAPKSEHNNYGNKSS